ncbi:S8 family serine peptidase [Kiritimatiellaeota bacterium B1221]|nr:S8 family serine peptidase [Kiritimatiellaeota bacterium B1221]
MTNRVKVFFLVIPAACYLYFISGWFTSLFFEDKNKDGQVSTRLQVGEETSPDIDPPVASDFTREPKGGGAVNNRTNAYGEQSESISMSSTTGEKSPEKIERSAVAPQGRNRRTEHDVFASPNAQGWYEMALKGGVTVLESFTPRETSNITYVRTDLKYPWIRLETSEIKINGEVVERWEASAGSHLILRKHPQVTEAELEKALREKSIHIISQLDLADTYLVGADIVQDEDGLDQTMLTLLSMEDRVVSVEFDSLIANGGSPETQPALLDGDQWPLHNTGAHGGIPGSDIDAISGWELSTDASEVVVAVVDTGIDYLHEDLYANIWLNAVEIPDNGVDDDLNGYVDDIYGIDAANNDSDPADDNGHGTHCAGIIGADGFNDVGISGVAPRVKLMGVKFLSDKGLGFTSDALEGISYAKNNGADVLNLSWGSRSYSESLFTLLRDCSETGMIIVASAGNDADNIDNRSTYPASFEINRLLTVSSVDDFDALSDFSNYGAGIVELAAPGTNVFSTWTGAEGSYRTLSGTSMAAPHVAGVAALLLAEFPGDSIDEILARLLNGCEPLGSLEGRVQSGRRLSLYGALNATTTLHNDTQSGAVTSNLHSVRWVGSNRNGETESGDETHASSVWYQWTPPVSGTGLIRFSTSENLYFDVLASEAAGEVSVLEGKEPGQYIFTAQKDTSYSILVYGEQAEFTIDVSIAPANDNRAYAKSVHGYRWNVTGSNLGATVEAGEINVGFGDKHSVWWRWESLVSGAIRIDTAGSDFDTMLAVFSENPLEGLVEGDQPEIIFVVDVSGSAKWEFIGSHIPDLNNDGFSNTVLDAEIAAVSALLGHINRSDIVNSNTVRVIRFDGQAFALDLDPVEPGIQTAVPSNADRNLNGRLDILESIETLTAGGGTNFLAALDEVEMEFENLASGSDPNMIFFSDGKPSAGASYTDVVQRLRDNGTFIRAFGVGRNASLGSLIQIDPAARIFSSEDELGLMISGAVAYNDDVGTELTSEVNLAVKDGETYYIKVSGYDGESGSIRLNGSTYNGLEIKEQPQSVSVEFGGGLELFAEVKGVPPLTYQWFLNGVAIEGANEALYEVGEVDDLHGGDYQLMVSNTFDHLMTDVATVALYRDPPSLLYTPVSQKAVAGANVYFDVVVKGTPPFNYQWYFEDEMIPNATAKRYTVYDFAEEHLGRYSVKISNAAGETQTAPAYLEFSEAPFSDWRFRNTSGPKMYPEQTIGYGEYFYMFEDNRVVRTRDGLTWQSTTLPIDEDTYNLNGKIQAIFISPEGMIAEYYESGYLSYYKSEDGLNWTFIQTPSYSSDLSTFNGKWYLNGYEDSKSVFLESDDLENWTVVNFVDPYLEFTVVEAGSSWRYRVDSEPEASNWYSSSYDSGEWATGSAEFGYGEGDEETVLPLSSDIPTAYFLQPFENEPGYNSYTIWGRVKYDSTVKVRFVGYEVYLDSSSTSDDPQGDWVSIPRKENINLPYYGDPHPSSVEVGRDNGNLKMSFDLELFASARVGLYKAVKGDDRVIVLKRNGDVYVSLDGENWTEHKTTGILAAGVAGGVYLPLDEEPLFLLGKFVGWDDDQDLIYLSDDGIDWNAYPYPEVEVPYYNSTLTQNVPFDRAQDIIEHNGQVLINHSSNTSSNVLASSDLLNWTLVAVPHEKSSDYAAGLGKLASNGQYLFASLGAADAGVFGSISDISVPQSYQGLDVSRLRIIDGKFVTFPAIYSGISMFSTDSEIWSTFLYGGRDAVYHDGNYYGLQRRYDGLTSIRKDSAVMGNTSIDWYTGEEPNLVLWPFAWEPLNLRYFSGQFVAAGRNGGIASSTDAVNWTLRRSSSELLGTILHAEVLNGVWLGMTNNGSVLTSTNGLDFDEIPLANTPVIGSALGAVASASYGNGVYLVCVENNGISEMYRSEDAVDWVKVQPSYGASPTGVAFGEGWFVAVAEDKVYYSQDGAAWGGGSLDGGKGAHIVYHMNSFWICSPDGVIWNTNMGSLAGLPTIELSEIEETYLFNSTFSLEAKIGTTDSSLSKVEFLVDGEKVFESTTGPFYWESADLSLGIHEIVIKAYDEYGRPTIQREEVTVVFSKTANVMPGAFQHPDTFYQTKDGTIYGLGKEQYGSVVYGAYLARSLDGRNWVQVQSVEAIPNQRDLNIFAELDNGVLLAGGQSDDLIYSQDGLNWEAVNDLNVYGKLISNGETAFMLSRIQDGASFQYSTDGVNWEQGILSRTGGSPGSYDWGLASVEYWKGRFVVLGSNRGAVAVSPDGFTWTGDNPFSTFGRFARLVAGEEYIVSFSATLNNGSYPDWEPEYGMTAYFSEDGLNWLPLSEKTDMEFRNLGSVDGVFYGVNPDGVWRSTNLSEWDFLAAYDENNDFLLHAELFESSEGILAIDIEGAGSREDARTIAVSSDFVDWEIIQSYPESSPSGLAYNNETFVANVGAGLLRSQNGRNWVEMKIDAADLFSSIEYIDEKWVAVGYDSNTQLKRVLWSTDLESWSYSDLKVVAIGESTGGSLLYLDGIWVFVDEEVRRSTDLVNWTQSDAPVDAPFTEGRDKILGGRVMGGRFVLLHSNGFFSSADGETWNYLYRYNYSPYSSDPLYHTFNLRFVDGFYVYPSDPGTSGPTATHIRSLDLTSWEEVSGFQKWVNEPWATIGNVGLAYLDPEPDNNYTSSGTYITFDGGEHYTLLPSIYSVSDIVATENAFYICQYSAISEMSLVDLAVENTSITYTQTPGPDVPITVEFDLRNIGLADYTRTGELKVSVLLAPSDYLDGSRSYTLFETSLEPPLAQGESLRFQQEVLVPRNLPAGDYHLGVFVDSEDLLAELNESNNLFFSPASLIDIPHVTLTVNDVVGGAVVSGSTLPDDLTQSIEDAGGGIGALSGNLELPFNIQLNLIAKPMKNYVFAGWEEFENQGGDLLNLNLTTDITLTPIFREVIKFNIQSQGGGVIQSSPLDLSDLLENTDVTLSAIADEGWIFHKWEGDLESSEAKVTIPANSSKQISAVFYRVEMNFEDWKSEYFTVYELPDAGVSSDSEDPDEDGFSNLYEYLLGTNPKDAEDKPEIKIRVGENSIDFEFMTDPRIKDYKAVIYSSSDLKTWSDETPIVDETTLHRYDQAERRVCAPLNIESYSVRFFRLHFDPKTTSP